MTAKNKGPNYVFVPVYSLDCSLPASSIETVFQEEGPTKYYFQSLGEDDLSVFLDGIGVIEHGGCKRAVIVLADETTDRRIRDLIPSALALRNWLLSQTGLRRDSREALLERLSEDQRCRRASYAELARRCNMELQECLESCWGYRQVEGLDEALSQPDEPLGEHGKALVLEELTNLIRRSETLDSLFVIFGAMGFSREEAMEIVRGWRADLESGIPAVLDDYPIDRDRMIQSLRTWRAGKRHKMLHEQPASSSNQEG